MKIIKFIIIILLIMFIVLIMISKDANAISNYKLDIINKEKVDENGEFKIKLKVENAENGILGLQGTIKFDLNKFEIIKIDILNNSYMQTFNKKTGTFLIEIKDEAFFDESKYLKENDDLMEITFKSKDNQKNFELQILNIKFVDKDEKKIEVENISKTIDIGKENILIIFPISIVIITIVIIIIKIKEKNNEKNI